MRVCNRAKNSVSAPSTISSGRTAMCPSRCSAGNCSATRPTCRSSGLIGDFEAHLASGAGDDAEGGLIVARVEVFAFGVYDVHDLFARDFADFGLVWLLGTGGDVGCFLQQNGG